MTFSSLALKNIRRNFKNYLLYIFSVTIAITFYYIFSSIKYNSKIMFATDTYMKFSVIMTMSSIVLVLFSAVFIWYCNAFFTKKRKKEVAMYTLLGVPKRRVARMLFIENILVVLMSLSIGILVGILFSRLFMMLVLKLMEIPVEVGFSVPIQAILDTTTVFGILFVIASVHSASLIYRFQVIDLFSASKSVEREPKTSPLLSFISILCLAVSYYLSQNMVNQYLMIIALVILILVIIGTFGLFSSFVVAMTKWLKRFETFYYKGDHLVAVSNIVYRIKTHARTLALIAILSATTLTAFGVCYSFYFDYEASTHSRYPHSYIYELDTLEHKDEIHNRFMAAINNSSHALVYNSIITTAHMPVTMTPMKSDSDLEGQNFTANFISEDTANEYLRHHNRPEIDVPSGEYYVMDPFAKKGWVNFSDYDVSYELNGIWQSMRITEVIGAYLTSQNEFSTFIVDNDDFGTFKSADTRYFEAYEIQDAKGASALNKTLWQIADSYEELGMQSFYMSFMNLAEIKGLMLFAGIFMGIVFLILTGAILYFKMINEAEDDRQKYAIMRKIGYSNPLIKRSIYKQMSLMFILPILLGILHAIFALKAFEAMLMSNLLIPIAISVGMYILVYFIFYILTVQYYYKTATSGK